MKKKSKQPATPKPERDSLHYLREALQAAQEERPARTLAPAALLWACVLAGSSAPLAAVQ